MGKYSLDMEQYAAIARLAAAEGCVLLKNDNQTLPLRKGDKVAVFGRIAFHYYKSGLGSGGLVNTRYVVGILDALKNEPELTVMESVSAAYENWIKEHPYDVGQGWGKVPWSQEEMPVTDELIEQAKGADVAIVVIGRTAGEDQDNKNEPGSYLLTDAERDLIARVSKAFPRTAVLLNTGNIIDMKWVKELSPAAVMYVWQGGQEGGNGVCDVLTGKVNPCGHLTDTIAKNYSDYPSADCFGDLKGNCYKEDIYVGYRYFETFAKEKVLYPFGFGLSYTTFSISAVLKQQLLTGIELEVTVKNTGTVPGKEVVQVYVKAPQGRLGKPMRSLVAFAKTDLLAPGEEAVISIGVAKYNFASYDDSGVTGHKSCYVLEEGTYEFYVGSDVRSAAFAGGYEQEFAVVEQLEEACAPVEAFSRMKPQIAEGSTGDSQTAGSVVNGSGGAASGDTGGSGTSGDSAGGSEADAAIVWEDVPLRTVNPYDTMKENRMEPLTYTGDRGYRLEDVYDGRITMADFIAQLSDEDLICMFRGEGMCSPKVTPGTAAAFGGLTESLRHFGIPAMCCTDGPSGLRFDCGTKAFSMPNGTLLGCTFDLPLVEALYRMAGLEIRKNRVDALLGPGMNIHRNPLNGRNFEYISEDPLVTGKISAAQTLGMDYAGVAGTAKHFCTNNQETNRRKVNAAVSERALREIYLKGYEIAVQEGACRSIMTTYGPLNGIWTAGNYDLIAKILRGEWNYDGIVMTDWWAESNIEGDDSTMQTHAPMIAAGNDLYMVTTDCTDNKQDDVCEKLKDGQITRFDLQRNAEHILRFILKSPAMLREMGRIGEEEIKEQEAAAEDDIAAKDVKNYEADPQSGDVVFDTEEWNTSAQSAVVVGVFGMKLGMYDLELTMNSPLGELAQLPVTVSYDNIVQYTISIRGTGGKSITEKREMANFFGLNHYLKFYFGADGIHVEKAVLRFRGEQK